MIGRLQVKQSFDEPSGDDTNILADAIEESQHIIRAFLVFNGCCWKLGTLRKEGETLRCEN
jgi:hypothetical protein